MGDVVRRRLARLPASTKELLGVAAVVGRDVEMTLLARAADKAFDAVLDDLEPAVVHRLLVDVPELPAGLRFSHALVREVLLEDMTSLRRARLHLKVADAIESGGAGVDDAEILAEHLWRAAPVGVGHRAADALERAAEVALGRVSYGAAEDMLDRAVQLRKATSVTIPDQEAELVAICRLLEVARARRYFEGAAKLNVIGRGKELAERTGQHDVLLNLLWFEWSALATSCRGEEAAPLALVLKDLTAGDPRPEIRATGHEVYAVSCWGAGRIAEGVEHLDIAMDLLAQVPPNTADAFEMEKRLVSTTFWIWHHAVHGDMSQEEASPASTASSPPCPTGSRWRRSAASRPPPPSPSGAGRGPTASRESAWRPTPAASSGSGRGQFLMHQGIVGRWTARSTTPSPVSTGGRRSTPASGVVRRCRPSRPAWP